MGNKLSVKTISCNCFLKDLIPSPDEKYLIYFDPTIGESCLLDIESQTIILKIPYRHTFLWIDQDEILCFSCNDMVIYNVTKNKIIYTQTFTHNLRCNIVHERFYVIDQFFPLLCDMKSNVVYASYGDTINNYYIKNNQIFCSDDNKVCLTLQNDINSFKINCVTSR